MANSSLEAVEPHPQNRAKMVLSNLKNIFIIYIYIYIYIYISIYRQRESERETRSVSSFRGTILESYCHMKERWLLWFKTTCQSSFTVLFHLWLVLSKTILRELLFRKFAAVCGCVWKNVEASKNYRIIYPNQKTSMNITCIIKADRKSFYKHYPGFSK